MKDAQDGIVLRTCKHRICKVCITKHFQSVRNCPVCQTGYESQIGVQRAGIFTMKEEENYISMEFTFDVSISETTRNRKVTVLTAYST